MTQTAAKRPRHTATYPVPEARTVENAPTRRTRELREVLGQVLLEATTSDRGSNPERSLGQFLPSAITRVEEAALPADPHHPDPRYRTYGREDYEVWTSENSRLRRVLLHAMTVGRFSAEQRREVGEMLRATDRERGESVVGDRHEDDDALRLELEEAVDRLADRVAAAVATDVPECDLGRVREDRLPRYWRSQTEDALGRVRALLSDLDDPGSLALVRRGEHPVRRVRVELPAPVEDALRDLASLEASESAETLARGVRVVAIAALASRGLGLQEEPR